MQDGGVAGETKLAAMGAGGSVDAGLPGRPVWLDAMAKVEVSMVYCGVNLSTCGGGDEATAYAIDFERAELTVKYCKADPSGRAARPSKRRMVSAAELEEVRASLRGLRSELAVRGAVGTL